MDQLMKLLERFVVAVEKIAEKGAGVNTLNYESPSVLIGKAELPGDIGENTASQKATESSKPPINDIPRDYDAIAQQPDGRDVLVQLCNSKGIEVKPRMKTNTLVKSLKTFDLAYPNGKTEEPAYIGTKPMVEAEEPPAIGTGPMTEMEPVPEIVDEDPFGADPKPEVEPVKNYTEEDVRRAFHSLMADKYTGDKMKEGRVKAVEIMMNISGVRQLPEVPKEDYAAVMKAIGDLY